MISQGGLEEVRVGLTCMRIKQCWVVVLLWRLEVGGCHSYCQARWSALAGRRLSIGMVGCCISAATQMNKTNE